MDMFQDKHLNVVQNIGEVPAQKKRSKHGFVFNQV